MSENSSDSESSCEWEIIADDGCTKKDFEDDTEAAESHSEYNEILRRLSDDQNLRNDGEESENKIDVLATNDVAESDASSDIEKIEEPFSVPTLEESVMTSSVCSGINPLRPAVDNLQESTSFSNLEFSINSDDFIESLTSKCTETEELPKESEDQANALETNTEELPLDMTPTSIRSYRHTPNQRLNLILNSLVALVLALVLGLGIGHFIGWSNQWLYQRQFKDGQISELKSLQSELSKCLEKRHDIGVPFTSLPKPCHYKQDYWKTQFEELMINKDNLLTAFTNRNNCLLGGDDDKLHSLQLDYLTKQKLQLQSAKQFEQLRLKEKVFLQKLKDLEEENNELKIKLEKEEKGDAEDQKIMFLLMKENAKLKLFIEDLNSNGDEPKAAIEEPKKTDDSGTKAADNLKVAVGTLKEQINQLKIENEDLGRTIARLRYGSPSAAKIPDEVQNNINTLQNENMDLKLTIGKMRYTKPPNQDTENEADFIKVSSKANHQKSGNGAFKTKEENLHESRSKDQDKNKSNKFVWSDFVKVLQTGHEKFMKMLDETTMEYKKAAENVKPDEVWKTINDRAFEAIDHLKKKWEAIQNASKEEDTVQGKRTMIKHFANLWRESKQLYKNLGRSVHKNSEKMLNNFFEKFDSTLRGLKSSWFQSNREKSSDKSNTKVDGEKKKPSKRIVRHEYSQTHSRRKTKDKPEEKQFQSDSPVQNSHYDSQDKRNNDWVFQRAQYREEQKRKARQADWLFDRARSRQEQRGTIEKNGVKFNDAGMCNKSGYTKTRRRKEENLSNGDWFFKT